jgi:hypothetical protein
MQKKSSSILIFIYPSVNLLPLPHPCTRSYSTTDNGQKYSHATDNGQKYSHATDNGQKYSHATDNGQKYSHTTDNGQKYSHATDNGQKYSHTSNLPYIFHIKLQFYKILS